MLRVGFLRSLGMLQLRVQAVNFSCVLLMFNASVGCVGILGTSHASQASQAHHIVRNIEAVETSSTAP